jgi:CheY-like chemotaxis protein
VEALKNQLSGIEGMEMEKGLSHAGGSPAGFRETLKAFCDALDEDINSIRDTLNNSDWNAYKVRAHGFKGVMKTVGMTALGDWGARLEEEANNGDTNALREQTELFCRALLAFRASLLGSGFLDKASDSAQPSPQQRDKTQTQGAGVNNEGINNTHRTVLIVDDEPVMLTALGAIMRRDYDVRIAKSGKSALRVLESVTPDILILDVSMADLDGFQLLENIRLFPEHAETPVIFVTAHQTRDMIDRIAAAGADYITKPAEAAALLAKVAALVAKRRIDLP